MAKNQIKVYTPIVWVEILRSYPWDNGKMIYDNEYLLWDGELETFAEKRATVTNIFFPRYERFIPVTKIGEFGLKQVEKQEAKEVEKPFNRTVESMFNIYKIRTNTRISKIVTGSFTAFKDNK